MASPLSPDQPTYTEIVDKLPFWLVSCMDVSPDGCFLWTRCVDNKGYGQYNHGKAERGRVHVAVWEIFYGPRTPGLVRDHICKRPSCFNPRHLQEVTNGENIRRGDFSRRQARAAKTIHCPQGHLYSVENTFITRAGTRRCRECSRWRRRDWGMRTNYHG